MTRLHAPGEDRASVAVRAQAPLGLEKAVLVAPKTVDEACVTLAQAHDEGRAATLLAGGTDWIVDRHLAEPARAAPLDLVVDLGRVDALREVRDYVRGGERRLLLGAGVTYWTLRKDARVAGAIPLLAKMAADVGAVQIQTRGTLGGNLATASPAADGVAALMALEAELTIASREGTRTVGIEAFFTGYRRTVLSQRELLVSIDVRVPKEGAGRWQKVGTRRAQAISKVALASVVEAEGRTIARARFGMASVAATTVPLLSVRAALDGADFSTVDRARTDAAVAQDIRPIDDVRSTGEYRLHVAKALVWRAVEGLR